MSTTAVQFPVLSIEAAPEDSQELLRKVEQAFGFIPNLMGMMSSAPALLEAYLALAQIFDQSSFSPTERQIILLATSAENRCAYCMAAHSAIAGMHKVDVAVINALRDCKPIGNPKLEALRRFTVEMVRSRGWPDAGTVEQFTAAGYGAAQALEVVLGIGFKTLSNYANHLAETPLDRRFAALAWKPTDCACSASGEIA